MDTHSEYLRRCWQNCVCSDGYCPAACVASRITIFMWCRIYSWGEIHVIVPSIIRWKAQERPYISNGDTNCVTLQEVVGQHRTGAVDVVLIYFVFGWPRSFFAPTACLFLIPEQMITAEGYSRLKHTSSISAECWKICYPENPHTQINL